MVTRAQVEAAGESKMAAMGLLPVSLPRLSPPRPGAQIFYTDDKQTTIYQLLGDGRLVNLLEVFQAALMLVPELTHMDSVKSQRLIEALAGRKKHD